ncbi:MAG: hypothetical protein PHE20_03365 [Patescibacteria group bacterium]|nr:hypothetical protein [Patescibacteria group bacterium]
MLSFVKKSFLLIFPSLLYAQNVMAANLKDAFPNAKKVADAGSYATYDDGSNVLLNSALGNIITTFLSLLGVIFIILSIYGGFLYLTSRGNQEQTKKALSIITQSLIGLIIILSAYAISYFIFKFLA